MNPLITQSILIVCVAAGLIQPPFLAQTPVSVQASQQSGTSLVKVFILAGQSNMEGQAVADLGGKDYFLIGKALGEAMADFSPFNRAELMTAEPEIYELMQAIWGAGSSR